MVGDQGKSLLVWISRLSDPSPATRVAAAKALTAICLSDPGAPFEKVLSALKARLRHTEGDPFVADVVIAALSVISTERAKQHHGFR
jgi:hypothetical protein